ncbi:MAG: hypothetical protein PWQ82_571 [Thermosediminibacterales bacterium]|nr:hypothetical protein [Thermosediminibacterales bacterium]MDK2835497.1 hypothetical protein [Thermosediminibacterales bacterium]
MKQKAVMFKPAKIKASHIADFSMLMITVVWGSNFVIMKEALNYITPFYYLGIRFILSFVLLSIVFWKKIRMADLKEIKAGCIIGFFLFMSFLTQTIGLLYTTPGKSGFITGINVIIVPFIYYFVTKDFPGWSPVIGAFAALLGMGILSFDKYVGLNFGDFLTLICAFFFAAQIVSIGIFTQQNDPVVLSVIQVGFTGAASLILALLFEPIPTQISGKLWIAILYAVVFCTTLAFLVQTVAQKYTSSTHAAVILCMEAVFAVLFSYIFWKEVITLRMIIGCSFILFGVLITELDIKTFKKLS